LGSITGWSCGLVLIRLFGKVRHRFSKGEEMDFWTGVGIIANSCLVGTITMGMIVFITMNMKYKGDDEE